MVRATHRSQLQVVLIAHSEGTIIASDVLWLLWEAVDSMELPEVSVGSLFFTGHGFLQARGISSTFAFLLLIKYAMPARVGDDDSSAPRFTHELPHRVVFGVNGVLEVLTYTSAQTLLGTPQ